MLKLLFDTQLPPKLSMFFEQKGFDSIHTTFFEYGFLLKDSEINDIAINQDRIIVTKDNDFIDNFVVNGSPPKVLLIKIGNINNNDLISIIERNLTNIETLFKDKAQLVILNKDNLSWF